ncbi:MAG: PilN domain-containing protein [Anaerolineae bacterium]
MAADRSHEQPDYTETPDTPQPPEGPTHRTIALSLAALGVLLLMLPLALAARSLGASTARYQAEMAAIQETRIALDTPAPQVVTLQAEADGLRADMEAIRTLQPVSGTLAVDWPAVMKALSSFAPNQMTLIALSQEGNRLVVQGRALDDSIVVAYARSLETSSLFSRVVVRSIAALPVAAPTAGSTATPVPPTPTPTTPVAPTATPDVRDAFEPDDTTPADIYAGQTQSHTFGPDGDVDRLRFTAKAGRHYRVSTQNLATGVDTVLSVSVSGTVYSNDDTQAGQLASSVQFAAPTDRDVDVVVTITNRGEYGAAQKYSVRLEEVVMTATPVTATQTPQTAPSATITPVPTSSGMDEYETDDYAPKIIFLGLPQRRTFYPIYDVDRVQFQAKAGKTYHVYTSQLAAGVDTALAVTMDGTTLTNDNRAEGDASSEVVFSVPGGADKHVDIVVTNLGTYGPQQSYRLTVMEAIVAPTPLTSTGSGRVSGLAAPLRVAALTTAQTQDNWSVQFEIVLELEESTAWKR